MCLLKLLQLPAEEDHDLVIGAAAVLVAANLLPGPPFPAGAVSLLIVAELPHGRLHLCLKSAQAKVAESEITIDVSRMVVGKEQHRPGCSFRRLIEQQQRRAAAQGDDRLAFVTIGERL